VKRSGTADLLLHGGRVPAWLANRMTELGAAICEHILQEYGASEFPTRLSDPFWIQAFGAVLGMDWHSSGITTSVMGQRWQEAPRDLKQKVEYLLFSEDKADECTATVPAFIKIKPRPLAVSGSQSPLVETQRKMICNATRYLLGALRSRLAARLGFKSRMAASVRSFGGCGADCTRSRCRGPSARRQACGTGMSFRGAS